MDEMRIRYHEDGRMVIRLGSFFPAGPVRLRKLLRVIDMDWSGRDEILDLLAAHLRQRIRDYTGGETKYKNQLKTNLEIVEQWKQTRR